MFLADRGRAYVAGLRLSVWNVLWLNGAS